MVWRLAPLLLSMGLTLPASEGVSGPSVQGGWLRYVAQTLRARQAVWTNEAQGIAVDRGVWFLIQRERVWRAPRGGSLRRLDEPGVRSTRLPAELRRAGYDHFGDGTVWRGRLLVPVEGRVPAVAFFDAVDLRFLGVEPLASQGAAPWVAATDDGRLYSSAFEAREVSRYRLVERGRGVSVRPEGAVPLSSPLSRVQGGAWRPDTRRLVLVSDHDEGGLVDVDPDTGAVLARKSVPVRRGFPWYEELEGLAWSPDGPGHLHLMMLDNDLGADDLYLKHYR